jgi:hypothetical protein
LLGLSLPLGAAGCLAGHALGYALVGTSRRDARIHGYLGYGPEFLGICVAVVTIALLLRGFGRLRGRPGTWPFALLAPLAFLAQELAERLVAGLPAHAVLEPSVFVGLAAQLPLAAVAILVSRALLRVADAAARTVAAAPAFAVPRLSLTPPPARASVFARPLACDHLGRAPPRS